MLESRELKLHLHHTVEPLVLLSRTTFVCHQLTTASSSAGTLSGTFTLWMYGQVSTVSLPADASALGTAAPDKTCEKVTIADCTSPS